MEIKDPGGWVTANFQWELEKANCSYITKITKMHYINIIVICNKLNKRQRIYSIWMIFIFINNDLYRSKGKGFTNFYASFHQVVCGIIWKDTWTRIFILRNLRGRPFDSEGRGGGGWHFLEINILTLKMLEIYNLSSSGKKINNLTLTC